MDIKKINDIIAVSGQVGAGDMAAIAKAGFKSVICNRPDGESGDQPAFSEIEQAAKIAGLAIRHLPVISGRMTATDVEDFGKVFDELPKPIFAYCRTGTRCATLWALDQKSRGSNGSDILAATQSAGYDLSAIIRG